MFDRCGLVTLSMFGYLAFSLAAGQQVHAGEYPAENITLYSHLTLEDMGAEFAEDCWGYTSPSGREYAIMGLSQGPGFIEITDPNNPVIVAIVSTSNRARDMKVYQSYVYSSSDGGPTNIIDVSQIDDGIVTFVGSMNVGAHNVVINEDSGYLYLAQGGPLLIYDLNKDPENPVLVSECHQSHRLCSNTVDHLKANPGGYTLHSHNLLIPRERCWSCQSHPRY